MNQFQNNFCTIYLIEDDIIVIDLQKDAEIDEDGALDLIQGLRQFYSGQKLKVLTDAHSKNVTANKEARKILSSSNALNEIIESNAIVVTTLAVAMIANFFMKVNKPQFKTKLFRVKDEAIAWLKNL